MLLIQNCMCIVSCVIMCSSHDLLTVFSKVVEEILDAL
uniref:Uncharacterized protein n=1 Tax=Anguilla anguilla TaxID=7936 RepID=A0A0E9S2R8_ANGAN